MTDDQAKELLGRAREARKNAYAPYSKFKVGAALLASSGKVYPGCNIENVSYGATICAERAALCGAVSAGESKITAIAIVGSDALILPCGMCRQVLAEFADKNLEVVCACRGSYKIFTLGELLPRAFSEFHPD